MSIENSELNSKRQCITDKEWLDVACKHFLQHAQQRIQYFNFFVIFSTILTTGVVSTFQKDFQARYLGIGLGLVQIFLAFMFRKIDDRNSFLTKHSEKIIKELESDYEQAGKKTYNLFTGEHQDTLAKKQEEKKRFFLFKNFTHGESYRIIYAFFLFIGVVELSFAFIFSQAPTFDKELKGAFNVKIDKMDTISTMLNSRDSILRSTIFEIKKDIQKNDSVTAALLKRIQPH